jgi:glucan phosphoethanolaminetransferase (alkaline phosphatase superfamily)
MIQRIQSIWFFLAALTLVLMLFLPIASKQITGTETAVYSNGLFQIISGKAGSPFKIQSFLPLLISNIAIAILCFINIFNYRKRAFQKRFAILSIALIGGFAFWCSIYAKKLPGGIEGASFGVGAYLPALAILFIVLAIFGINKDERLIRSAERLR